MAIVVKIGSIRGTQRIGHYVSGVFVPCIERRLILRSAPRLWVVLSLHRGDIVDTCDDGRLTVWYRMLRFVRAPSPCGWRRVAGQLRREWWTR